jgi:hypothetical protein
MERTQQCDGWSLFIHPPFFFEKAEDNYIKSRSDDIKIKLNIKNYTLSPNFKSVCKKKQGSR